jgi:hypothetical protein
VAGALRLTENVFYMGAKTVVINYQNIPWQIQNPKTHSFSFVSGGPVTAYGRDLDPQIDGPQFINPLVGDQTGAVLIRKCLNF